MQRSSEIDRRDCGGARQGAGRTDQSGEVADRRPSGRRSRARPTGPSAMPRCQAASTSSARALASTKSRPCRRPRSTRRPASSASRPCWRIPPANGCRRTGRSARSPRRRRRTGWERRSPMPGAMRCSPWSALPARTTSMRRISMRQSQDRHRTTARDQSVNRRLNRGSANGHAAAPGGCPGMQPARSSAARSVASAIAYPRAVAASAANGWSRSLTARSFGR